MGSKIVYNKPCPRCGGRLYIDTYEVPPDIACLNCGKRWVLQTTEPQGEEEEK